MKLDIYGHRTPNGNGNLPKEVSKRRKDFNGVPSMISADEPTHRRMRRLQAHMFAEKALAAQESLIKEYVDLLISKLHEKAASPATNVLNMVLWYKYVKANEKLETSGNIHRLTFRKLYHF